MKRKVIFDTDIGTDDAVALTTLLLSDKYDVIGITTTHGNQPVDNTTDNALRLVDYFGFDIPVYKGCSKPMVRGLFKGRKNNTIQEPLEKIVDGKKITIHAEHICLPETKRKFEDKHACSYIVDTLRNSNEKINICAVGPLTNIGMAFTMDHSIYKNIDTIYIMGGGIYKGNRTPSAEANFYDDPEAAEIVLNSGCKVVIAPLEGCESMKKFDYNTVKELEEINTKASSFLAEEIKEYLNREQILFGDMCTEDTIYDLGAVIPMLDESLIKDIRKEIAHVDCSGGMADGTLICDRRGFVESDTKIEVIYELDKEKSYKLFLDIISK